MGKAMAMPVNENPQPDPSAFGWSDDDSASELEAFSTEQLAAMNRVLIALLRAASLPDLISAIHKALCETGGVRGCAHYCATEGGDLLLNAGAGDFADLMPEYIPADSDILSAMKKSDGAKPTNGRALQQSLFEDAPKISFWSVYSGATLTVVFACAHSPESEEFITAVCRQIAISVDTFYTTPGELTSRGPKPAAVPEASTESTDTEALERLTSREIEVLDLLCKGLSNKEIASQLFISLATCKHHVENILLKLHVHSRAGAVAVGIDLLRTRASTN
jgi:DNA-binding CsgD family transcriptional regulator